MLYAVLDVFVQIVTGNAVGNIVRSILALGTVSAQFNVYVISLVVLLFFSHLCLSFLLVLVEQVGLKILRQSAVSAENFSIAGGKTRRSKSLYYLFSQFVRRNRIFFGKSLLFCKST